MFLLTQPPESTLSRVPISMLISMASLIKNNKQTTVMVDQTTQILGFSFPLLYNVLKKGFVHSQALIVEPHSHLIWPSLCTLFRPCWNFFPLLSQTIPLQKTNNFVQIKSNESHKLVFAFSFKDRKYKYFPSKRISLLISSCREMLSRTKPSPFWKDWQWHWTFLRTGFLNFAGLELYVSANFFVS